MSAAPTMRTVRQAIDAATARLAVAGIDTARLDARVLMAHVMERDQAWLIGYRDVQLPTCVRARYKQLVARRAKNEPIAYLTGVREFWSLDLRVTPDTLIPRPDSETIVEAALEVTWMDKPQILDLGTGSGCLLLAILTECRHAKGLGIDINEGAVGIAKQNARILGLSSRARFRTGTWAVDAPLAENGRFDLVVSNPPYIPNKKIADMAPDVRYYEPLGALSAGADGLSAYREIAGHLHGLIVPGGHFVGEFGLGQGTAVEHILNASGLQVIGFRDDVAGRKRCVIARRHD